jgi:hypothetical protein
MVEQKAPEKRTFHLVVELIYEPAAGEFLPVSGAMTEILLALNDRAGLHARSVRGLEDFVDREKRALESRDSWREGFFRVNGELHERRAQVAELMEQIADLKKAREAKVEGCSPIARRVEPTCSIVANDGTQCFGAPAANVLEGGTVVGFACARCAEELKQGGAKWAVPEDTRRVPLLPPVVVTP